MLIGYVRVSTVDQDPALRGVGPRADPLECSPIRQAGELEWDL